MSKSRNLFIAYCEENENIAIEISQKLKRVGFKFEQLSDKKIKGSESLADLILHKKEHGIMLISDNFLKSEACMQKMLGLVNNNAFNNIQPVIIDGRYPSKDGKGFETFETTFDRVSNVIKYMNFWQECYIDLRKEKRTIDPSKLAAFDEKITKVKAISSEIGDFLRVLRTKDFLTYQDFQNNDFERFFKKFGDDGLFEKYKTFAKNDPKLTTSSSSSLISQTEKDRLKEAAEKEIVIPVLEEKVAEIDVNAVENIIKPVAEEEMSSVIEEAPSANIPTPGAEQQQVSSTSEIQTEISNSFEQQIEEIIEEVENEELQAQGEEKEEFNPDENDALESIFEEEEEEDITHDFDPAMSFTQDEESSQIDQMIFEASNSVDKGKVDEAILKLKKVLKLEPQNNGARYMYAMLLLNYKEDLRKAQKQLKKVVELDPQNCEAFENLAKIAELNNDFPLASKYYKKVIELEPNTFGVYYKLGLITAGFYKNKKKLALKYFKKAIKQDKNNADAHYRLAILLKESLDKPKRALKHFKKVLTIDPKHQFANYDLALLYHESGNQQKAALFYEKAWKINPEIKTSENDIVFSFESPKYVTKEDPHETAIPSAISEKQIIQVTKPGKVVFITGATAGIGKATAELFASKGYRLILNGRRVDRLNDLQNEFDKNFNAESKILPFDVRNIEDVKKAIEELEDEWSQVDILINNAGLAKGYAPVHEGNIDHWETMIDTNLKGLLYLTRAITPHMVKRQSGHIINVCSSAGHEVYPKGNVYCATKFAVDALTKSMRLDLYKHNIRVGQVSPGHVEETEFAFVRHEDAEKAKIYEDFQPLKSKDVAEAIYFMVTAPPHVNIQDIQMMGTQQASNVFINRSGR